MSLELPLRAAAGVLLLVMAGAGQELLHLWAENGRGSDYAKSLAGIGDVNGDGYGDVAVGAFGTGYVELYSGRDGSLLRRLAGKNTSEWFGHALANLGDVDGDGHSDVLVGVRFAEYDHLGGVRVFSGRTGQLLHDVLGVQRAGYMGSAVAGGGDLDADGVPDFMGGAIASNGEARIWSGKTGTLLRVVPADSFGDGTGAALCFLGDLNRDGHADYAIGKPKSRNVVNDRGRVVVYSGKDGTELRSLVGQRDYEELGTTVAAAGDVDRDGVPDVLAGAWGADVTSGDEGRARVFSGATGALLYTFEGEAGQDRFGVYMDGLGDLDGDGHADFVIGTQARSPTWHKVYSGRQGQLLARLVQSDTSLEFYPVGWGGDLNADGFTDVVVGKPMAGGQVRPAGATAYTLVRRTLVASAKTVSLGAGGEVFFQLRAAPGHAGHPYLLLATMSGIRPGLRVGSVLLPLNPDILFSVILANPGRFLLHESLGYLDAKATATARLVVPEGSPQTLYGTFLDHAYLVFEWNWGGGIEAASHPVPVQLVR